jgi:hypothetical protein
MLPFPIDSIGSDKEFVDYILSKQKDNGAFCLIFARIPRI